MKMMPPPASVLLSMDGMFVMVSPPGCCRKRPVHAGHGIVTYEDEESCRNDTIIVAVIINVTRDI
jgi:hypothetical protein